MEWTWTNCIGKNVMVDDGENQFHWQFEGIGISEHTMTQTSRQSNGGDWAVSTRSALSAMTSWRCRPAGNAQGEAVMLANADRATSSR